METEGSLMKSHVPGTCPYRESVFVTVKNFTISNGTEPVPVALRSKA